MLTQAERRTYGAHTLCVHVSIINARTCVLAFVSEHMSAGVNANGVILCRLNTNVPLLLFVDERNVDGDRTRLETHAVLSADQDTIR